MAHISSLPNFLYTNLNVNNVFDRSKMSKYASILAQFLPNILLVVEVVNVKVKVLAMLAKLFVL